MRNEKVGRAAFLAAWCHKYLLHPQQYSTATLPTASQVTARAPRRFPIPVNTHSRFLPLSLCLRSCSCSEWLTPWSHSCLHTVVRAAPHLLYQPPPLPKNHTHLAPPFIAIHQNISTEQVIGCVQETGWQKTPQSGDGFSFCCVRHPAVTLCIIIPSLSFTKEETMVMFKVCSTRIVGGVAWVQMTKKSKNTNSSSCPRQHRATTE